MDTALAKKIGQAARAARRALDRTQQEVAEEIGISVEFYARIERGGTLPSVPTLAGMARVLLVSADALLGTVPAPAMAKESPSRYRTRSATVHRIHRSAEKLSPTHRRLLLRVSRALERTR